MLLKDKKFYRMFLILCLPIVLQNVISLSVNLTDNLMLGSYAESALSGVTAVNQIQFIYQNLLIGIGDGLVILASQYWGKKDTETIRKVASIAMRTALVLMLALFVIVSLFPEQAVGLFTNDAEIIAEGVKYLNIVRFTYPFFCVTTILLAVLRSTEVVKIAFYLSLSTLCINFCINWCLIYGRFGLPRLGVQGAAIGTLVARIVECIIILCYVAKKERNLGLKLWDFLHVDCSIMRDYYRVSLPILFISAMWGVNTAMQTAILGHLTSSAIAANSMASNLAIYRQDSRCRRGVDDQRVYRQGNWRRRYEGSQAVRQDLSGYVPDNGHLLRFDFVCSDRAGAGAVQLLGRKPRAGTHIPAHSVHCHGRHVLSDAGQFRHHQGRRCDQVRDDFGLGEHLVHCHSAVVLYGVLCQGIAGRCCVVPEFGSDF